MARPTRSNGRPGTPVIPPDWATSHRPTVEKTLVDATVELRHPGTTQAWSDADQQNRAAPQPPYWTGGARIQALATQARLTVTAGDREVIASYLVVVPAAVAPDELDLVTVAAAGDEQLAGRTLQVVQVVTGSLVWERDLFCTLTD